MRRFRFSEILTRPSVRKFADCVWPAAARVLFYKQNLKTETVDVCARRLAMGPGGRKITENGRGKIEKNNFHRSHDYMRDNHTLKP